MAAQTTRGILGAFAVAALMTQGCSSPSKLAVSKHAEDVDLPLPTVHSPLPDGCSDNGDGSFNCEERYFTLGYDQVADGQNDCAFPLVWDWGIPQKCVDPSHVVVASSSPYPGPTGAGPTDDELTNFLRTLPSSETAISDWVGQHLPEMSASAKGNPCDDSTYPGVPSDVQSGDAGSLTFGEDRTPLQYCSKYDPIRDVPYLIRVNDGGTFRDLFHMHQDSVDQLTMEFLMPEEPTLRVHFSIDCANACGPMVTQTSYLDGEPAVEEYLSGDGQRPLFQHPYQELASPYQWTFNDVHPLAAKADLILRDACTSAQLAAQTDLGALCFTDTSTDTSTDTTTDTSTDTTTDTSTGTMTDTSTGTMTDTSTGTMTDTSTGTMTSTDTGTSTSTATATSTATSTSTSTSTATSTATSTSTSTSTGTSTSTSTWTSTATLKFNAASRVAK